MKDNINLYDFNNIKLYGLTEYKDLKRERDINKGGDTLSFLYPKKDAKTKNIKEECYLETREQRYVIKEIDIADKDWINVIAKIDTDGLKSKVFDRFEMVNSRLGDTLNLALAGTGWTIGHNDVTKRRTVRLANCTPLEIIEEIRKVYRAEIFYDARNKKIDVYEQFGEDKGSFFREDINLKELSISSDTYDYVTRLIPIGKDGLTIESINGGKKYLENNQYSDKVVYAVWEDNRYTVVENLKEDGIAKLEELSKPLKSYKADVVDLNGANLGDTIELVSKTDNVKEKQRVVKITEYPLEPWNSTVEIANKTLSFEDMQNEVLDTVDTVDTVITSDGMVDDSKVNLDPIRQEVSHLIAEKVDVTDFNAAVANIGELIATKANITDLKAVNARIDTLYAEDLTAINADITHLKGNVAEIDTILAKEVFAELASVGQIVAGSSIIADGAIGDAQISSLNANKLRAGTIDTSLVTVAGADGKLNITGNRLQVIHDGLERVALGDVNRDGSVYGLRVRGQDGQTVLFDERGLTKEGLTDGAVDDSKVDDSANIQGHKLDINSVIREVNSADEVIKGTRVQVGDRSLEVELSTMRTNIGDNSTEISNQRSQIAALDDSIKLKVDTQTFNSYKSTNDNRVTTIDTQLQKNTSSINVLKDEIALKVTQADIDRSIDKIEVGGRNLFRPNNTAKSRMSTEEIKNAPTSFYADKTWHDFSKRFLIDEDEQVTVSFWAKTKTGDSDYLRTQRIGYTTVDGWERTDTHGVWVSVTTEWQYFENTFTVAEGTKSMAWHARTEGNDVWINALKIEKGTKATDWTPAPEDTDEAINTVSEKIDTKVREIRIDMDGITSRVTDAESSLSGLDTRVSSAEQKITPNAIVQTVRSSTAYTDDLNDKVAKDSIISEINQTPEEIKIQASKIRLEGLVTANSNFKILTDGSIEAKNADISGKITANSGTIAGWDITSNYIMPPDERAGIGMGNTPTVFWAGYNKSTSYYKFRVTRDGDLYSNGGTITGTTIRTSSSGDRLQLDGSYLRSYKNGIRRAQLDYSSLSFYNENGVYAGELISTPSPNPDVTNEYVLMTKATDGVLGLESYKDANNYARVLMHRGIPNYPITYHSRFYLDVCDKPHGWSTFDMGPGTLYVEADDYYGNRSRSFLTVTKDLAQLGSTDTTWVSGDRIKIFGPGNSRNWISCQKDGHSNGYPIWVEDHMFFENNMYFAFGSHPTLGGGASIRGISGSLITQAPLTGYNDVIEFKNSVNGDVYMYFNGGGDYSVWLEQDTSVDGNLYVTGSIFADGSKLRAVKTENYNTRLINAFETPEPLFADFGSGKIGEDGTCVISIDDVFLETVSTDRAYRVILTAYDPDDSIENVQLKVIKKEFNYFVIKGSPGLEFDWQIVAKQKEYEDERAKDYEQDQALYEDVVMNINLLDSEDIDKNLFDLERQLDTQSNALEIENLLLKEVA